MSGTIVKLALVMIIQVFVIGCEMAAADADNTLDFGQTANGLLDECEIFLRHEDDFRATLCVKRAWTIQATTATLEFMPATHMQPVYCTPKQGYSNEIGIRVFVKYANEHPNLLSYTAESVFLLAMQDAYPCRH